MHLLIAKVDETVLSAEVYSVTLPTSAGELTILGGHMPLATTLKEGVIRVRMERDSAYVEFGVTKGVLEITKEGVTVLL